MKFLSGIFCLVHNIIVTLCPKLVLNNDDKSTQSEIPGNVIGNKTR